MHSILSVGGGTKRGDLGVVIMRILAGMAALLAALNVLAGLWEMAFGSRGIAFVARVVSACFLTAAAALLNSKKKPQRQAGIVFGASICTAMLLSLLMQLVTGGEPPVMLLLSSSCGCMTFGAVLIRDALQT